MTTYPSEVQHTVDFKYWNARPDGRPPRSSPEIGFGYNVSSRWFIELTAQWFQMSPGSNHLAAKEWQNDFMPTQGQYPIDVAFHTNVERAQDDEWKYEAAYLTGKNPARNARSVAMRIQDVF